MKNIFIKTGTIFYGIAMVVYGVQQFVYGDFRNVLFPPWQLKLPLLGVWAYLFGVYLIGSGVLIIINRNRRNVLLALGGVLLFFFVFLQIPYEMISEPYQSYHLGLWISALKELALAGGAFVLAGAHPDKPVGSSAFFNFLSRIIPYGSLFFCVTIVSFGISHFMHAETVAGIVPEWMPDRMFWNYFGAVALIGSGLCIILDIRLRAGALLLGIMIFAWFWLLHLPGAWAEPSADRGNNLSSAFDALAFSGTAFVIAFSITKQKWIAAIEQW